MHSDRMRTDAISESMIQVLYCRAASCGEMYCSLFDNLVCITACLYSLYNHVYTVHAVLFPLYSSIIHILS